MSALRGLLAGGGGATVGIDIGKRAIKVAQVRRTAKGPELQRFGVAPTPRGSVEGGLVLDPPAVAQVLQGLLRSARIGARRVIVAVTGQNVLARVLRFPPIPEDEVKRAIRWEAERHLPFPVDEAVIDVQTVRQVTQDNQRTLEVLLAAAPEALVLTYIQTLQNARLTVDAIEVAALAMARGLAHAGSSGTHVLVNLGASMTDVAVVHDGVPQFTRTILVGGDTITQAISKLLQVDEAAAEQVKMRYGLGWEEWPPERGEGAYAAQMVEALSELVTQVRRSLDFFRAQFAGVTITDMILCGGGALLRHLDRHLTGELDLPVTIGNPLDGMQPGEQQLAAQALAPQLAVAMGLAMRTIA
jgi:type IV pilus assembly protein PilM